MGRPRRYDDDRVETKIRLPADLHERLKAAADDRVVSQTLLVEKAVAAYLDALDNVPAAPRLTVDPQVVTHGPAEVPVDARARPQLRRP